MPTAKDVAELTRRVDDLSAAVAKLSKAAPATAAAKTPAKKVAAKAPVKKAAAKRAPARKAAPAA